MWKVRVTDSHSKQRWPQIPNCSSILQFEDGTWWLIPLSKWVITPVINGISRVNPLITGVITHLLSGMSHQVPHWYVTGRHDHPTKSNSSGGAEAFRDLPTRKKARTLPAGELSQSKIYIYIH